MLRGRRLRIGVLIAVVAVYSGWWWISARTLQARVDAWVAAQKSAGATIAPDRFRIGGYPFAFAIAAEDVGLNWPNGFGFAERHLRITARPWSLHGFHVTGTGGFSVDVPPGSERPAYVIAGETLRGSARFADDPFPVDLALKADSVSAAEKTPRESQDASATEATVSTLEFSAARPAAPPKADTDVGLTVTLHLVDVAAPPLDKNPLGASIDDVAIRAEIMGPLPAATNAAGLKAWRDAGGTLDLEAVSLQWGKLAIAGNGTAALDPEMQPEGAFAVTLTGYDQAIDALIAARWLKPGPGSLAKLALDLASTQDRNGQRSVKTPLTVQSRHMSLGPIKLGELPPLTLD